MKRLLLALAALPLLAGAVEVDGIVAKVNSATILRSDVIREMRHLHADASRYEEILNECVERQLILQAAAQQQMVMQEWVLDSRILDIVNKAFDGDRNRLMDMLAKQKVSYPEWRQRLKDDMVVQAMRWQVVDKNVRAAPGDIRRQYAAHPEKYVAGGKATVSVILLKPDDAAKKGDVTAALATNDFASVARAFSADARAAQGGVWADVVPADVFQPAVCEALGRLKVGETGDWVELDGWNFLIRKDAEADRKALSFAEAYDLVDADVREALAERLYREWIARLRAAAYVKIY